MMEKSFKTINVVTRGGDQISVDINDLGFPKVQNVGPRAPKFEPMQ